MTGRSHVATPATMITVAPTGAEVEKATAPPLPLTLDDGVLGVPDRH